MSSEDDTENTESMSEDISASNKDFRPEKGKSKDSVSNSIPIDPNMALNSASLSFKDVQAQINAATVLLNERLTVERQEVVEVLGSNALQYIPLPGVPLRDEDIAVEKSRVRIVVLSDLHEMENEVPNLIKGDILLVCGDYCNRSMITAVEKFDVFMGKVKKEYGFKDIIVIPGNHDYVLDVNYHEYYKTYLPKKKKLEKMIKNKKIHPIFKNASFYLQDSSCICQGIKFYGMPYMSRIVMAFFEDQDKYPPHVDKIPSETEILVTHEPPFNVLDLAYSNRNNSDDICEACSQRHRNRAHWGSYELGNDVFNRIKPKVHVFGHVHEEYGHRYYAPNEQDKYVQIEYNKDSMPEDTITFVNAALRWDPMRSPPFFDMIV